MSDGGSGSTRLPERRSVAAFVLVSLEIALVASLAAAGIKWGFAESNCGEVCSSVTPFLVMIIILSAVAAIVLWRAWSRGRDSGRVVLIGVALAASTMVLLSTLYLNLSDGQLSRVSNAVDDLLGLALRAA
jgi:ABC-type Fe3+-siderophore transport system permease subunit